MFSYQMNENLSLKLFAPNDAENIFHLTDMNRDFLRKWLPWIDFIQTVDDSKRFIQNGLKGYMENKSLYCTMIYNGKTAGVAGFKEINQATKTAQMGFWLGESFTGKGIAVNTAKALTQYAFKELKLQKVEIRVAINNEKARNIPEKLHFKQEGIIRNAEFLNGKYIDQVVYGLLIDEWE